MAKCAHCGKKGFFLKVNLDGVCKDCERVMALHQEETRLQESVHHLEAVLSDSEKLYADTVEKAKADALASVEEQILSKRNIIDRMNENILTHRGELDSILADVQKTAADVKSNERRVLKLKELFKRLRHACDRYKDNDDLSPLSDITEEQIDAALAPTVELTLQCMNVKSLRQAFRKNKKQIAELSVAYQSRYTTKTNAALYKLMVIALEAELQNVLYNIGYGKLDTAVDAVKEITAKYLAIAIDGNQNIAPTMKRFIGEIEYLFMEAVKIEYEYYVQKERTKEEQRAIREQMRQEAEERRILEQQRGQFEKEASKYRTELENVEEKLATTEDEGKKAELHRRIEELRNQLENVAEKKDKIINLQNGQAGHVYVISNLGSFGDQVFKVGMTRRLDPQERVNELGDASVPFPFDVQSFIFSENAVDLERTMHERLGERRLNKINLRKEFFKVSLDEIESLVLELQPTAEFNRTLLAQQYYQSVSIEGAPADLPGEDEGSDDEEEYA